MSDAGRRNLAAGIGYTRRLCDNLDLVIFAVLVGAAIVVAVVTW